MNTATQSIECPYCFGDGTWEVECCNGSYGCSCGGSPVHMGNCNVCKGTGKVIDGQYDIDANLKLTFLITIRKNKIMNTLSESFIQMRQELRSIPEQIEENTKQFRQSFDILKLKLETSNKLLVSFMDSFESIFVSDPSVYSPLDLELYITACRLLGKIGIVSKVEEHLNNMPV